MSEIRPWKTMLQRGKGLSEEDKQAGGCATVSNHIQPSAELGALLVGAGCVAVKRVKEA